MADTIAKAGTGAQMPPDQFIRSGEETPPYDTPSYVSTTYRGPRRPLVPVPQLLTETTGPLLGDTRIEPTDYDLTAQHEGEPLGERMVVAGEVRDSDGRAVPNTLIEIWQANAAGRYRNDRDQHPAPLDPNFSGYGRCLTDSEGRYRFTTILPGSYPWENHQDAWRPAHIHFSLFGRAFTQRLITQMYFPGDPLMDEDPVSLAVPDPKARERLTARLDHSVGKHGWTRGFSWDIVLRGSAATPFEDR